MPVFNGADTIEKAIAAVLAQTFADLELVISDNASTDGTLKLCQAAASKDDRVRIVQQQRNIGAVPNFAAVLSAARAPYFMFAAADDHIEPNFIKECLAALEAAPDAVSCAPRTLIHFADGVTREPWGCKPIGGGAWLRPALFLLRPADNSRFYGLHRTEAMRLAYLDEPPFTAFDWAVSALTLAQGSHVQSQSIILHREGAVAGKYAREHLRSATNWFNKAFPLARMSAVLLPRLSASQLVLAIPALALLNVRHSAEFFAGYLRGHTDG